ncbi:MAG: TonB-dependent receptor [Alphaproteobacteria bacterium]|nr:TonB-dependent receptor [Alphaproteobacteria bacterium]
MRIVTLGYGLLALCLAHAPTHARDGANRVADPEFDAILARDLSDLTVMSVSKRSQRLSDTAAAVYVITQEDIRRAGVYSIPDALRMVPGLQVAKISGDSWAISSRGFSGQLSNKLLVLIDGRAIYTPVFSGVYWGDQSTTINDIDRIEVIRGPGASLYGANAVNGVVNIITKSAENTQGNLVSATATARGNGLYEARHGGRIGKSDYYRIYGQYSDMNQWYRGRGGFRWDGQASGGDRYTLQGDAYGGNQDGRTTQPMLTPPYSRTIFSTDDVYGGNILGRWSRTLSNDSEVSLQGYIDHYSRLEVAADQHISTADVQLQHSVQFGERHHLVWGGGLRFYDEDLRGTYAVNVGDERTAHGIVNAFIQDEYTMMPETLYLTLGSKFELNDYTGFEVQPTARFAWHPAPNQTVWGAVSRAVRTPSSLEDSINLLAQVVPGTPVTELRVFGNPDQESEELIAYELGHRLQFSRSLSFDTALFYSDYDNLQTIGAAGVSFLSPAGTLMVPYRVNNLGSGKVYGVEIAATWNVNRDWRLGGSYSYIEMDLEVSPGASNSLEGTENLTARHQFAIQSFYNLTDELHWDNMLYFVDHLTSPVDGYVRYDTRLAWLARPGLEVSLIGRNLIDEHREYPSITSTDIGRSVIGQILWKF